MGHVSMDRCKPWVWGAAAALGWFAGIAAADSTPPQLISFNVSPSTVDSSAGPGSFIVSITAQDTSNGFGGNASGNGGIALSLGSGTTVISRQGLPITGGTAANPVFQFALTVPQFTPAGVYSISLTLTDNASNTATFSAPALQSLGFTSSVTITENLFGSLTLSSSTANLAASGGAGSVQAIASNSGFAWTAASNAAWLTITSGSSGTGTGTINYFASANGSSSQRTGIITAGGQTFTVIQAAALSALNTTGESLAFTFQIGGATPPAQTIVAYSTGVPLNFTASATSLGNWLFVSPANGVTSTVLSVFINPFGLGPGTYSGAVTVSAPGSANGSRTEAVTLTVSGTSAVTITPNLLSFSYQQGGSAPAAQALSITAGSATGVSASASSVGGWLAVDPANSTTPAALTVSVSPANLAPGTYNGSIAISTVNGNQAIAVTIVVSAGSVIAINPGSLTFSGSAGGASPSAQTLSLSGPVSGLSYTATASNTGTGNWLSVGASTGTIPGGLVVSVNTLGLTAGEYTGTISLSAGTGTAQIVPVTLILNAGAGFTVTPALLTFAVQSGASQVAPQFLIVTPAGPDEPLTVSASTQDSQQGWLTVSPNSLLTSRSVSVAVNPSQLTAGAHMGGVTITGPGGSQTIPVTVLVNAAFAAAPASLTFAYQTGGSLPTAQTVAVNASPASLTFSAVASSPGAWLSVSPATNTTPATVTIAVNPAGLAVGSYTGTVTLQASGLSSLSQSIPVTLTVNGNLTLTVSPAAAQVNYQLGDPNPNAPLFSLSGTATSYTATASSSGNWLAASPASGAVPATVSARISPTGLAPGTYTGTIQIVSPAAAPQTYTVTLNVVGAQSLTLSPASLTFAYQPGGSSVATQNITVGCPNSALAFRPVASSPGNWLIAKVASAQNNNQIIVSVNPAGLAVNTYQGTITIFGVGACNSVQTVPVTLTVGGAGPVTTGGLAFNVAALSFAGPAPAPQAVSLTCSGGSAPFTATVTSNQAWLSVSPLSGTTPAALTVSVNPAGLNAGSYVGLIGAASSVCSAAQPLTVTLTVSANTATAPSLAITPASLVFTYQNGSANPATQTLSVGGPAGAAFAASSSGAWLSVSPATGSTPAAVTVSVNPVGLAAGTYLGAILISSQNVAVTLTVSSAPATAVQVTSPINFTYQVGDPAPAAQSLTAAGVAGTAFTATATSPSNWLSVTPASGTLPATLSVAINPAGLAAGSYAGLVTITPAGAGASVQNVVVTLQIAAAGTAAPVSAPFLTSFLNGASLLVSAIAPGEIISIFGHGLGPAAGVGLALTPSGLVANSLGGVRLLFDGVPAPLLYAQDGQINAIVPYAVAGESIANFRIEYQGVRSAPSSISVVQAAPAIFTVDQSGHGQGAILNQDTSVNSDLNPADSGSIVTLYASGAGLLSSAAQDGAVTSELAGTALPVSILVDGQNTDITYAGPAPGLVSGVLQVNFRLPQQIAVGKAVGLLLKVGRFTSQPGVTLAIR